ncbi:nucleoside kinase [Luteococcus sanguinis]|uniref:Nucleoside kinase n=1 Tax=Luteococcus sanguinis TaxID=174038 RepID=A0ABW1X023_9ACTN
MGEYNLLVEGVSGTGKTSVCHELRRRGYQAINGDTELAYQGDPSTGLPSTEPACHEHHLWCEDRVWAIAGQTDQRFTFFCGGSRNFKRFLDVFDEVFVLDVDRDSLLTRLSQRPSDEFGSLPEEKAFVLRLHELGTDVPASGVRVDATQPLGIVVDQLLTRAEAIADDLASR